MGRYPPARASPGSADAATSGLDYYGACYYDPAAEQFTSADTWLAGGLHRYGYVGGNPETFVDPGGHCGQSCEIGLCGGPDNGIPLDQGGNPGGGSFGGGGGSPPPEGNETDSSITNAPITNPNDPAYEMEPPTYLGSSTETSETAFSDAETQHLNQVNAINQEERDQHAGSSTQPGGGNDNGNGKTAGQASVNGHPVSRPFRQSSTDYENRVKGINGDPTIQVVGGQTTPGHQWNGAQPVTNADGTPIDRGWAGPDAVRDYGQPGETWIEAKLNIVNGEDLFANPRNATQFNRYINSGRPFEYWLDETPSQGSINLIIGAGGIFALFP